MKKSKEPPRLRRRIIAGLFLLIALAILGTLAYSFVNSRVVHVRRTELRLADLPIEFEGKTVLFLSDPDMVGLSGPSAVSSLMDDLKELHPDLLILGGDYAGDSLLETLNSSASEGKKAARRRELFSALADFPAPLGKFAVAGEEDAAAGNLAEELRLGEIQLLSDSAARVQIGSGQLCIVGLKNAGEGLAGLDSLSSAYRHNDCVIAVAHSPASISGAITAEAGDTGQWCDVFLTGHTHGGQMVLGDRSLLQLTEQEKRYPAGWTKESGVWVLVSNGLGCDSVNLRLNAPAEVHLITLTRATDE